MPGIIVSRPIFNTLFKLAHEQGLSINAFLTKLLENSGPDAVSQAVNGSAPGFEPVEQVVDEGSVGRVDSDSVRAIEGISDPKVSSPTNISSFDSQSGDSYIGETEKNLVAPTADSATSTDSDDEAGDSIWKRVVAMEGHKFSTSRGKKFAYKVAGEYVIVKDSSARIPRSQFAKAEKMWPVKGPSQLVGVYAPSVVWAIMKELIAEPVAS